MPAARPPRRTAARGAVATAVAIVALTAAAAHGQAPEPAPPPPAAPPSCFGAAARDQLHPCRNPVLRLAVVPAPSAAKDEPNAPCNSFHSEGHVNVCSFGVLPEQATRTVALVGDSHASHWRAPLDAVARENGWRGLSITRRSCPLSTATRLTPEPTRSHCIRWVNEMFGFLSAHPEIDTLFVVGLAGGRVQAPTGETMFQAEIDGYRKAWATLPETVRHIVVIHDTPRITRATVRCLDHVIAAGEPPGGACARPRTTALPPDAQVAAARAAHSERLQVIDLTRVLCSRRVCFPVIGGALVYKDLHHLSLAFSQTLAIPLAREVRRTTRSWLPSTPVAPA